VSDLRTIRAELAAEAADVADLPDAAPIDDPEFDQLLAQVMGSTLPDGAVIEAWMEGLEPLELSAAAAERGLASAGRASHAAPPPDLRGARERAGVTAAQAAGRLGGITVAALERLEGSQPLRWLNVNAAVAAAYVQAIGVRPAHLLRWIAGAVPPGPSPAYGYRPRLIAEEPVTVDDAGRDTARVLAWGHELLHADADDRR
jgi:hypothetical protein